MDRQTVIEQLVKLPTLIETAEMKVLKLNEALKAKRDALETKEIELTLDGAIDGKNAETRMAQLKEMTKAERDAVQAAENNLSWGKAEYNRLQNDFKALRSIAGMSTEVLY